MIRKDEIIFFCALFSASLTTAHAEEAPIVEGLPEHLIYMYTSQQEVKGTTSKLQQLFDGERRWETGRVLRVCMFGGNKSIATLIKGVAEEWNNYSSVKLDFGTSPGGYNCLNRQAGFFQIRIGFNGKGYWSAVGRDSEFLLDPLAPSMNLEGFNRKYSEGKYSPVDVIGMADAYHKATIRHEFGHALGLLHEHQNTNLNCYEEIKWSGSDNVYDYFRGYPNNWEPEQVDRNLGFIGQTDPDFVAGEGDMHSIMFYPLPSKIFKNPASKCANVKNYEISELDKKIVAAIYPPVSSPNTSVDIALSTASIRPLPSFVPAYNRDDLVERALVDLESNDTFTRRDARVRLADLVGNDFPESKMSELIKGMEGGSYRYQLGVSTALSRSKEQIQLNSVDKKILDDLAGSTKEKTLKRTLEIIR